MKLFVRTILVVLLSLVVVATPVNAGDVLDPGDIAIIGFNFDNEDEFAFVCLKEISAGTEIRFTDQGWKSTGGFYIADYDGPLSWQTPSAGCKLGEIVKIRVGDFSTNMSFNTNGDQILVYQWINSSPVFIFGLNSDGYNWTDANSEFNSAIPSGLDISNTIAITEIDNAIYIGPNSFTTPGDALSAIVNKSNWTGSDTVRQIMPSGSFSFTTTAVELSNFSAETMGESAPWWMLVGLVVIPILLLVVKRQKRNC